MEAEKQRMNTIVKTDMEITLEFKKQAKLKGLGFPESLEQAMQLFINKAKEREEYTPKVLTKLWESTGVNISYEDFKEICRSLIELGEIKAKEGEE